MPPTSKRKEVVDMVTYETLSLLISSSMLTLSLISLIIVLIKAISKGKK